MSLKKAKCLGTQPEEIWEGIELSSSLLDGHTTKKHVWNLKATHDFKSNSKSKKKKKTYNSKIRLITVAATRYMAILIVLLKLPKRLIQCIWEVILLADTVKLVTCFWFAWR